MTAPMIDLEPPNHVRLRPGDRPFWLAVLQAREGGRWDGVDLIHSANLARCHADIERIGAALVTEGDLIRNRRGSLMLNPRHRVLEMLTRRAMATTRLLGLHGRASGNAEDRGKRRAAEAAARIAMEGFAAEGGLVGR